jgi:tRNA/tmRNA/rRNA uracil-C5-methylase (TrmA/RlmC/RlmD family)
MDPPRKGADERFLASVLAAKPNKIIYVSCDPATLARDIATLIKSYKIESITPVDMFPQTFHVETVTSLILKK